jgi:hypothetical protein
MSCAVELYRHSCENTKTPIDYSLGQVSIAAVAQLAARRSHNLKVVSSILACRIFLRPHMNSFRCDMHPPTIGCMIFASTRTSRASAGFTLRRLHGQRAIQIKSYRTRAIPCVSKTNNPCRAAIAQLGERQTEDLTVPGSIPGLGIFNPICLIVFENQVSLAFLGQILRRHKTQSAIT